MGRLGSTKGEEAEDPVSRNPRRFPRLAAADAGSPAAGCPDADLLARFVVSGDEAAFELLLLRHGPMVLGTCRRVLPDPNDADDAFQATFLVLARKAGSVGRAGAVAAWLHRVAHRAALRVRADRARRAARETPVTDDLPGPPTPDTATAELGRVLDEEVARLPARHRAVFVLCGLGERTGEEAARVLGCPPGTVSSRLTRARARLRARLTRRGFAPAVVAAALAGGPAPAVPARLADPSLTAALAFAVGRPPAGLPPRPVATAEGVMRAMVLHKVRLIAVLMAGGLLLAGGVLGGAGAQPEPATPPRAKLDAGKTPAGPPEVRLVRPGLGGLNRVITHFATTEAAQQADVGPGVAGLLKVVAADLGDRVTAGQVLAEVDAPELALDVRQATAEVRQTEGLLGEAEARVVAARAEVAAARGTLKQREADVVASRAGLATRQKRLDRVKALAAQNTVTETVVGEAEEQFRAAEAQVTAQVAGVATATAEVEVKGGQLALVEAAVGTARANVEAAKVGLERARLALDRARVTAPFDGVVVRRTGSPGETVRLDVGRPALFTIIKVDSVRVVVAVPEAYALLTRPGVAAEVFIDALPNSPVAGVVARVGFALDPTTRSMRAEVDIPNQGGRLRPGMTGNVTLRLGKGPADALRVPATAVAPRSGLPRGMTHRVYVYRDGRARLTPVRTGYANGGEVEVVAGLTVEDQVVADPRGLQGEDVPVRPAGGTPARPE